MSRFSKAEAEARGWTFVHSRDEYTVLTSDTQSEFRTIPATYVAEKYVDLPGRGKTLIHEEGETTGKLLERINSYEETFERFQIKQTPTEIDYSDPNLPRTLAVDPEAEDAGEVNETVIVRDWDGNLLTLTDAEWSSLSRNDAIYDGQMKFFGPSENAGEAVEAREDYEADKENRRAAPFDFGEHEQVTYDTADRVDSPGQGAGGVLIVRKGEGSLEEIAQRKEAESAEQESQRVAAQADSPFTHIPAPEGQDDLAGVDVTLGHRGDLDTERPRVGETAEAAANPPEETFVSEDSTADVRSEATEEKAKEIRDDKGRVEADKPEAQAAAVEAGAEAEQKQADEAADGDEDSDEDLYPEDETVYGAHEETDVNATPSARKLAEENDIDLEKIEGTGKDGKITRPDVENYLACQDDE